MPKAELVSAAEFARRQKISAEMVRKAKAMGVFKGALVDIPGKKKPLLKYKLAAKFYEARLDPNFRKARQTPQKKTKAKPKGGNGTKAKKAGGTTFVSARAEVEKYKAAEYRLKHEINAGLWLKKSDVEAKAFRAGRLMRDNLLNIPARTSALVAAESDQSRCYQLIHDEVKAALDEYIRQLEAITGEAEGAK
jgi:hypothetical protein